MFLQLVEILGQEKVSQSETQLYHHSKDESDHTPVEPDIVVFPSCKEDVVAILEFAMVWG